MFLWLYIILTAPEAKHDIERAKTTVKKSLTFETTMQEDFLKQDREESLMRAKDLERRLKEKTMKEGHVENK